MIAPETTECQPLKITVWPLDKHWLADTFTYAQTIAVCSALMVFIADSSSYGNLYIYVFSGVLNVATINMQNMQDTIASNLTTSDNLGDNLGDNLTTSDTNLNLPSIAPYNISTM